jgi:hypothetical protein
VSAEVPETLTEVGLKFAVTPFGNPPRLSATAPVKPLYEFIDIVKVVLLPGTTDCVPGVMEMKKLVVPVPTPECGKLTGTEI